MGGLFEILLGEMTALACIARGQYVFQFWIVHVNNADMKIGLCTMHTFAELRMFVKM